MADRPEGAQDFWEWFVAFRDPREIWKENPSFLCGEYCFIFLSLLTLIHAFRNGGRYPWLWLCTILHGLTVESVSYLLPDIDSFWHYQASVIFLGKRLPLYIVCLYPVFLYTAAATVARLRLSSWVEPMAVGLAVVLIDLPYDIMGVKMLWWTWHDTDPNIYDRHYWVPWTSYYFHAAFAAGFTFLFHGTRRLLSSTHKFQADNFIIELVCSLVTGMFGMALGVLQFLPLYHPLHDNFKIHTEVCVLIFLGAYALLVWAADRNPSKEARPAGKRGWFDILCLIPLVHYAFFFLLSIYGQPEKMKSTGLHEPIGDCSAISPVYTAFGQVLSKRTFLCASDFDEQYFNFECLNEVPPNASDWYTVCGTPFPNHVEYMIVVGAECFMGLFIYFNMLYRGGAQPGPPKITLKSKSKGKRE